MKSTYLSVVQAAHETTLSRQAIWKQIQSGALKAIKVGESYIIPTVEITKLRRVRLERLENEISILKDREKASR